MDDGVSGLSERGSRLSGAQLCCCLVAQCGFDLWAVNALSSILSWMCLARFLCLSRELLKA